KHHCAPDGGVAEAERVAEFVGKKGFEVVGLRVGGESGGRGKGDQRIAGIEINVGVEDLTDLGGGRAAAELDADLIGGDDPGEGKDAGSEGRVRLIEADGVDAIGAAEVAGGDAGEGAKEADVRAVPLTLLQTLKDCWMACSISLSLPAAVWSWVRMVVGLLPRTVLQRKAMAAGLVSWREGKGQAEPPETPAGSRTSGTISLKE